MEAGAAAGAAPEEARQAVLRSVFGHAGFRCYWAARLCSALAIQMQAVAVGWQVYDLTRHPLDLGFVGLVQFLPAVALALVTGQVADRYDRRRVFALCLVIDALCAVVLFALTAAANTKVVPILAVLFVFGVARAFEFPAAVALMPNLIPARLFVTAAAWSSSAWQTATIVGPAAGGVLYVFGPCVVYSVCTLLFLGAALLVLLIRVERAPAEREAVTWASFVAGITFIRTHPVVLGAVSLDLFAVLLGGATALLPIYARDILHVGPQGLGLLRSAPAIGALGTALVLARRPITRRAGQTLLITVAIFGLATIGFGLSRELWLSLAMLVILGASDMVSVVIRRVLVLAATPDEMRGRVTAVESVFIVASNELGEFESGVTAAWFGTVPAVVLGGCGTLAVVASWAWLFPQLRRVDTLEATRAQE
ncbi:MAG: MFS transporter [Candidatus Binatia bacterium]|nr:MFS transporter [Candidatus Binatia bacterium]